jgi:hypothetical protein
MLKMAVRLAFLLALYGVGIIPFAMADGPGPKVAARLEELQKRFRDPSNPTATPEEVRFLREHQDTHDSLDIFWKLLGSAASYPALKALGEVAPADYAYPLIAYALQVEPSDPTLHLFGLDCIFKINRRFPGPATDSAKDKLILILRRHWNQLVYQFTDPEQRKKFLSVRLEATGGDTPDKVVLDESVGKRLRWVLSVLSYYRDPQTFSDLPGLIKIIRESFTDPRLVHRWAHHRDREYESLQIFDQCWGDYVHMIYTELKAAVAQYAEVHPEKVRSLLKEEYINYGPSIFQGELGEKGFKEYLRRGTMPHGYSRYLLRPKEVDPAHDIALDDELLNAALSLIADVRSEDNRIRGTVLLHKLSAAAQLGHIKELGKKLTTQALPVLKALKTDPDEFSDKVKEAAQYTAFCIEKDQSEVQP